MKKRTYFILSMVTAFILLLQPIYIAANNITPRLDLGCVWYDTPKNLFFYCDFDTNEREAVRAAMNTWNAVDDTDGTSIITMFLTTGEATNVVEKVSSYWQWVGHCDITQIYGEIISVRVQLGSEYKWSTTGEPDAYDVQTVALHELGHALGVAHCHEADEGDGPCWSATCLSNVMYPIVSLGEINTTLKSYDISSYRVLY